MRCAIEVQKGMVERNVGVPPDRRIEFRIGIHLGDVVEESDGDLMGDGVNIAARLESIAEPNGICLSNPPIEQVRDKFKEEFVDLGEIELKNIARPVRAYRMRLDARPARLWFLVNPLRERRLGLAVLAAALLIIGGLWWIWAVTIDRRWPRPESPFSHLTIFPATRRTAASPMASPRMSSPICRVSRILR